MSELNDFQNEVWGSLEKYSIKLGWGLTGIQGECWTLLDMAVDELVAKRDMLRWRKWPEERPEEPMTVWLCTDGGATGSGYFDGKEIHDGNNGWNGHVTRWTHWRPIGNLPEGSEG